MSTICGLPTIGTVTVPLPEPPPAPAQPHPPSASTQTRASHSFKRMPVLSSLHNCA